MKNDSVLEHWNRRAEMAECAGSNDLIAKRLEINAIANHICTGMKVAEFGCGNGITAIELVHRNDIDLYCYDFSPAMIEFARRLASEAGMDKKITFEVADVRNEPLIDNKFDVIYSERMIINLPDWQTQLCAIKYITDHLNIGGRYLMCENSRIGLENLNRLRNMVGLLSISPPWHNVYLDDHQVASIKLSGVRLAAVEPFSATYYFLSRVVNAWIAAREDREPSYDAPVNKLALELPSFGDCAQGKLWIFEKVL